MNVLLKLSELGGEPHLHLDQLLDVLSQVSDGFTTRRDKVWVGGDREDGWDVTAGGYFIGVQPEVKCGFSEEGDGKVLTALLTRLAETKGQVSLSTTARLKEGPGPADLYMAVGWRAGVCLGALSAFGPNEREGKSGVGWADYPGTAVLVAYLMAWGVVE